MNPKESALAELMKSKTGQRLARTLSRDGYVTLKMASRDHREAINAGLVTLPSDTIPMARVVPAGTTVEELARLVDERGRRGIMGR